jgi:acyl-coenzyme A synthetase/AMP-(fatty) acid ligase
MFGAWKAGGISSHISVLQAANLEYFLLDSTPRVLIYAGDMHETVMRARKAVPELQHCICMDGPQEGALDWNELLRADLKPPATIVLDTDRAHLSYTSGTSGKPKGAVLPHGYTARATHCIAERLGLSSQDISLGPTSLASSYQLVANLLPGVHRGVEIGVRGKWDPDAAWDEMEARGVTLFVGNPIVLTDLLNVSRVRGRKPRSLRIGLSGGAPVPPELKTAFYDELGVCLVESYGQSELGGFVALGYPRRESGAQHRAIGPALPDKEVWIAGEDGKEQPVGEAGEMIIRGGFMTEYWKMPEKTTQVLRDGWLHTGDMGRMDSEGYIYLMGRWSERIITSGRVIYPRAMEEALYRHSAVRYVAVIGRNDLSLGQIPLAIVALYDGKHATEDELMEHCRRQLGPENSPHELQIIPEMPMTPTGKISKAELMQRING